MVRTEVKLERNGNFCAGFEISPQHGATVHKVAARVILIVEGYVKVSGSESVRCTHYCREELLLASEPVKTLQTLAAVASPANLFRLLVSTIIAVEFRILDFIFITLLHTRHGYLEVDVKGADISRYKSLSYE